MLMLVFFVLELFLRMFLFIVEVSVTIHFLKFNAMMIKEVKTEIRTDRS